MWKSLYFVCFLAISSLFPQLFAFSDAEPRFIAARLGKRFRLDYSGPELIYQRCTNASPNRQFAFKLKGFSGWTTNGSDRIDPNTTRIYQNGTLEIDKFKESDHGIYSYPQRDDVCPLNVYTTLNGWIQDCQPNTYSWVLQQKDEMNELQLKHRHSPSFVQINRGHYNYRTKLYLADEAVFEVKIGSTVRLNFGPQHFVVQRVTDQIVEPQFTFAFSWFSGWTVTGFDKFDTDRTKLYSNGTLVIKDFRREDVGKYSRPLDPLRSIQPSMYYLLELPGFINATKIPSFDSQKEKPKKTDFKKSKKENFKGKKGVKRRG